ncbi:MAG: prepilin-type N-terminal cleavage/methylation domain-containing protein [Gammaproteobacteria bacterium]|nr:prepilin-type N-terminal cleavage/methylation domain-containing protein [Gammaproteobacteria bacterium]
MRVRTKARGRREQGLTLVELIVVIAIIGILIGAGFMGLLTWLKSDNETLARNRLRTDLQAAMSYALQHPPTSTANGNWSLQLVKNGSTQTLYVCTGSAGGCAGNLNPANGPVEVRTSNIPDNVNIAVNGAAMTCLGLTALAQPILAATATTAANACVWPVTTNGEWVFSFQVGSVVTASTVKVQYVF